MDMEKYIEVLDKLIEKYRKRKASNTKYRRNVRANKRID